MSQEEFRQILLALIGFFGGVIAGIFCYFFNKFSSKLDLLNETLIVTVERQGWQYKTLQNLEADHKDMNNRVTTIEGHIKLKRGQESRG